jgi:hypothetical protein
MDNQDKYADLISQNYKHSLVESGKVVIYRESKIYYPNWINPHTILMYRIDNINQFPRLYMEDILALFENVKQYNVKCLIFHGYEFPKECTINAPKCLREVVFSKCKGITQAFYPFFDRDSNVTSVTFRNINKELRGMYCLAKCYLEFDNYKMKCITHVALPILLEEKYQEDRDICLAIIDRNKRGYEKCRGVCLVLLGLRKYNRTLQYHKDIIVDVCKRIWDQRYKKAWY